MKKWICDHLETSFFWTMTLCAPLWLCEVIVLVPWVLGFPIPLSAINALIWLDALKITHPQSLVNTMLELVLITAPSAAILSMVRPDFGLDTWIGRMYDKYYTVKFLKVYYVLHCGMLLLVASQIGNVFDESLMNLLLVMSTVFAVTTLLLCSLYNWAIKGTSTPQPT